MLNRGTHRTTYFVLFILLLSSLPLASNASADQGIPEELQAQDITAVFDATSETTTVSWRNIAESGGNVDLYEQLWDATYHVYRSDSPIDSQNVLTLSPWHSVVACDEGSDEAWGSNPNKCRGAINNHPGHSATYQVGAGTDNNFFYAIVTELGDGNMTTTLSVNSSSLYEPVQEVTTPIRSPYNLVANFDPATSKTTIQWINYNSINPVLPEDGNDAYQINLWRTEVQIDRSNGYILLEPGSTPIATLNATTTIYEADVPPLTNREVYYSVTYFLPNWTSPGVDYEDIRFLSNNALNTPVVEDNTPPADVSSMGALFTPSENGTGVTTIVWDDILSEQGEQYRIYRHGEYFNSTNNPYVQLIGTVQENLSQFQYNVPFNTYGDFVYCVVIVDRYGATNPTIPLSACDSVSEDSDEEWVKEPTNVQAEFIGNGITRVTWTDQVGVEGERYHVWRSSYRVQGPQFAENISLMWMGSVPDGVEKFDVQLEDEMTSASTHYFVTSEAMYNCAGCSETMTYTKLVQNWAGPITEDTKSPQPGRMLEPMMVGELKVVDLEWVNAEESGESYTLYRHFGDPFGDSEFAISNYTDPGWEFVEGPIPENGFSTIVRQIPVPDDSQRTVWYCIIVTDSFGNTNKQILPGIGGNAVVITEDTMAPTITYTINDEDNVPIIGNSLVRGEYTLKIEVSESLLEAPMINLTTSTGGSLTGGSEQSMVLINQNTNDPNKGPEYFQSFSVSSNARAGNVSIVINLTDMSLNTVDRSIEGYAIDARAPEVTIFSPTAENDGAKYLYGNEIKVVAGATDDVELISMQIRFVQNYGTSSSVTEPWRNVTGLTISENGDWTIEMVVSSGSYLPGVHEVSVKALDSAGNQNIQKVRFVTDWCRHRDDGSTICEYSNPVQADPDVVYPELNATDPPYMIAWVTAGLSLLAVIASLVVISSAMSGPKKKGDDDDEGDDWMNEFIGTSSQPDMEDITGGAPAEKKVESTPEPEEDDPFAVNVITPKRRRKKKDAEEEEEEDVEWEEGESPRKKPKRRAPARRKTAKRKRS